jgi:hypothetical protein
VRTKFLTASFLVLAMLAATGSAASAMTYNLDTPSEFENSAYEITNYNGVLFSEPGLNITSHEAPSSKNGMTVKVGNLSKIKDWKVEVEVGVISGNAPNPKLGDVDANETLAFYPGEQEEKTLSVGLNVFNVSDFNLTDHESVEASQFSEDGFMLSAGKSGTSEYTGYTTIKSFRVYDPSTDNTTDNSTDDSNGSEYNITKLRDVPGEQSFDYLNSGDSENITINDTVMADSDDAVFLTKQIRADKFDRIELTTEGAVTAEVLDAQSDSENESILKTKTATGKGEEWQVNISEINTTGIQIRLKMDNGTEITDFKLYGDMYDGGLFGGGNLITGNFLGGIPVVGEFLSGFVTGLNNVISGILNVPVQIFEGIMEVIPSL